MNHHQYRAAVLVASTRGAAGQRPDLSGPLAAEMLQVQGFLVVEVAVVPDDVARLQATMRKWLDQEQLDLVVTSGGTGLAPTDVTPEATRPLLTREIPGLAEAMRAAGLAKTPMAALSRGLAGQRNQGLILNLPGSPKGVRESLAAVLPALEHALAKIQGSPEDCAAG